MIPIVHGLEEDYWGQIDFVYLDHLDSKNQDVMQRYNFVWRPTFILIEPDGTEVQRWFGYVPAGMFRQAFNAYLEGA